MDIKKILTTGVVIWIVNSALGWLSCGYLFNWVYEIPPNIWLDESIITSTNNIIGASIIGIISAMIFVFVYAVFYKGIPGRGIKKGVTYGILIWMVAALSGMASMPFYMTIATTVVVYWIALALVMNIINGIILGKMYRCKR